MGSPAGATAGAAATGEPAAAGGLATVEGGNRSAGATAAAVAINTPVKPRPLYPSLLTLDLGSTGLKDADIAALVFHCPQLRELDIHDTAVTAKGIARMTGLKQLTLLECHMMKPPLTEEAGAALGRLPSLKVLTVSCNRLGSKGMVALANSPLAMRLEHLEWEDNKVREWAKQVVEEKVPCVESGWGGDDEEMDSDMSGWSSGDEEMARLRRGWNTRYY
jgi:hypothetical protein